MFQSTGVSNEVIHWDIISALNHKYGHSLNIGENIFPTFMQEYNQRTNQKIDGNNFLKSVFDTLEFNTELVSFLKAYGDITIVSDNYRENIQYISQRYAFERHFADQVYSFDYQMVKAEEDFFKRLISEKNFEEPEKLIFIDDSPEKLKSAAKHGIRGILFNNNQQLFNDFQSLVGQDF